MFGPMIVGSVGTSHNPPALVYQVPKFPHTSELLLQGEFDRHVCVFRDWCLSHFVGCWDHGPMPGEAYVESAEELRLATKIRDLLDTREAAALIFPPRSAELHHVHTFAQAVTLAFQLDNSSDRGVFQSSHKADLKKAKKILLSAAAQKPDSPEVSLESAVANIALASMGTNTTTRIEFLERAAVAKLGSNSLLGESATLSLCWEDLNSNRPRQARKCAAEGCQRYIQLSSSSYYKILEEIRLTGLSSSSLDWMKVHFR